MRKKKPRRLEKTPKFLMPKNYREFLRKAMAETGRDNSKRSRPTDRFSRSCLVNNHESCSGWVTLERGRETESVDCLCHCQDRELVE